MKKKFCVAGILLSVLLFACSRTLQPSAGGHREMVRTLKKIDQKLSCKENPFAPAPRLKQIDSVLRLDNNTPHDVRVNTYARAIACLQLGDEKDAIRHLQRLAKYDSWYRTDQVQKDLAMAYLRLGERVNCVMNHASASCIMPIRGSGLHQDRSGSQQAIEIYERLLRKDPGDLESKWLLNIAYMTLGDYPAKVPPLFLIPGLDKRSEIEVQPFEDIAGSLKIDVRSMAGGSVIDDFNNDGFLDIIISSWGLADQITFFINKGEGTLEDVTSTSGLKGITGGLNLIQADYNNDGFVDLLVLRGAWKGEFGKEPNSLLRNNGDNTFTDVTLESGLLSFHPTQTATWSDFNNDGWIDLFIGNETDLLNGKEKHPCELYMNNGNGSFTEISERAKCNLLAYVKGVTSADYNNDGWQDIFLSTMNGGQRLLRNNGIQNGKLTFEDVGVTAGLPTDSTSTFTSWFWDYDNDGWADILTADYSFERSLAFYAAAAEMKTPIGNAGRVILYHNNQDGTFTNASRQSGLDEVVFSMGGNFGDIDNDGLLDMYFGTGNPRYQSLIPNKLFRNMGNGKFADVTASARVGHLQKGHGVSFTDMDNDGDQDIFIQMGGAYPGDAYQNSFFDNPGQGDNRWISLKLVGTKSNRSAIGTRVTFTIVDNGMPRTIHRDVNSGGSFGASPLRLEVGLGLADKIEKLEIRWAGTNEVDVYEGIKVNQFIQVTQGQDEIEQLPVKRVKWILPDDIDHQHHGGHRM